MKDISQVLKNAGLKITPTRELILNVFSNDCEPINAELIHKQLKSKKVDIVTIYRNLTSFENAGILKRVDLQKDSVFYELAGHHHHHIICTNCGLVESFDDCDLEPFSKKILTKSTKFKTISKHSFELFGLCKSCSRK